VIIKEIGIRPWVHDNVMSIAEDRF